MFIRKFGKIKFGLYEFEFKFHEYVLSLCYCFFLGTIYSRRNMSKSNKSVTTLSSISVGDCGANIDDDYKDTPLNVEVTDQGSTNKDNIVGIPTLLGPFSDKIIA
jgi:hypothetical protein